jgi:hypothetical protein
MPKGSPSKQTIASDKYQKKAGYMVKGFKVKRDIVEEFTKACEVVGITSQAAWLTEQMQQVIDDARNILCCDRCGETSDLCGSTSKGE